MSESDPFNLITTIKCKGAAWVRRVLNLLAARLVEITGAAALWVPPVWKIWVFIDQQVDFHHFIRLWAGYVGLNEAPPLTPCLVFLMSVVEVRGVSAVSNQGRESLQRVGWTWGMVTWSECEYLFLSGKGQMESSPFSLKLELRINPLSTCRRRNKHHTSKENKNINKIRKIFFYLALNLFFFIHQDTLTILLFTFIK